MRVCGSERVHGRFANAATSTMMKLFTIFAILASATAFKRCVPKAEVADVGRRAAVQGFVSKAFFGAALAGVPMVAQAQATLSSPFIGTYADPNHPKGYRTIAVNGAEAVITGKDDPDAQEWIIKAKISGNEIFADFSPKGGPKDLKGEYKIVPAPSGIVWPDGNKYVAPPQQPRPAPSDPRTAHRDPRANERVSPSTPAHSPFPGGRRRAERPRPLDRRDRRTTPAEAAPPAAASGRAGTGAPVEGRTRRGGRGRGGPPAIINLRSSHPVPPVPPVRVRARQPWL